MFVVCRSQRTLRVRAVLDHLAHELLAQPAAAVLLEDVDVREVDERVAVGHGPAEADLAVAVVEADDALRLVDQPVLGLARPAERPVRDLAQEPVHLAPVDPLLRIVQLEAVAERPFQADTVRSRKPPCSS